LVLFSLASTIQSGIGNLHRCGIENQQVPALASIRGVNIVPIDRFNDYYARGILVFNHLPTIFNLGLYHCPDLDQDQPVKTNIKPT
jgi:hypothetical protein